MSSLTRGSGFAQRNNNLTKLVPVYEFPPLTYEYPFIDVSNCPIYTLNLPDTQHIGGIYNVDLSDVDSNGLPIDLSGLVTTTGPAISKRGMSIIGFNVNITTPASLYPGQEFTIFFKNIPTFLNGLPSYYGKIPSLTICIFLIVDEAPPIPYILSPPGPSLVGSIFANKSISITYKSDGENFNIVSSGPAGWFGQPAFAGLIEIFENVDIPPGNL